MQEQHAFPFLREIILFLILAGVLIPTLQRLRGEQQLADYPLADIAELANAARGADAEGYRAEFVKLVRMAEALGKAGQAGQP